jgi:hypothetical protein
VIFKQLQKAAVQGPDIDSPLAAVVFLTAQGTVVIRIASSEVLAEPLVGPDVIRS